MSDAGGDAADLWGYTHTKTANTFEAAINDRFNRLGQIAFDKGGFIGDILVEYRFNRMGRCVLSVERTAAESQVGRYRTRRHRFLSRCSLS